MKHTRYIKPTYFQQQILPIFCMDIQQIHARAIRPVNGRIITKEQRSEEIAHQRNSLQDREYFDEYSI